MLLITKIIFIILLYDGIASVFSDFRIGVFLYTLLLSLYLYLLSGKASNPNLLLLDKFSCYLHTFFPVFVSCFVPNNYLPLLNYILYIGMLIMLLFSTMILGENFNIEPNLTTSTITRNGPYQYLRHPIYSLNLCLFSLFIINLNLGVTSIVIFVVYFLLTVWRLNVEERELMKNGKYQIYLNDVRYKLIPYIY